MAAATGSALTPAEFAGLMREVGPFERPPRLAVAVSGGRDSLALSLLAAEWAAAAGGAAIALTVDHRLRPAAAAEARAVGSWLKARGIGHRILTWLHDGAAPASGIQEAARAARYRLLSDWCRARNFLHLALAHHQEDQAETLLLRLAGGSGPDGLAAMAPIAERAGVRLIRPLLTVPRDRLAATLDERGQPWIDDPSNDDPAFARVRLRRLMPALAAEGLTPARLAAAAAECGRARAAMDDAVAALLAHAASPRPAGSIRVDRRALTATDHALSRRALERCLIAVGGADHGPRGRRLDRLWREAIDNARPFAATLAGCRIQARPDELLIFRESASPRRRRRDPAVFPPQPMAAARFAALP